MEEVYCRTVTKIQFVLQYSIYMAVSDELPRYLRVERLSSIDHERESVRLRNFTKDSNR